MRRYTMADGMPHDAVSNILEDDSGSLWVTTGRGLSKLVDAVRLPDEPRFVNFDTLDGLQGAEFTRGASYRSESGRLYFGGPGGLNSFRPERIIRNEDPPPVVMTGLRILNRLVIPGETGSPLEKAITEARRVTLSPGDSVVTFEFAALNLVSPQKNRYAYWLEGFEREWNEGRGRASATYTNLPRGRYGLHVRASNNHGVWAADRRQRGAHHGPRQPRRRGGRGLPGRQREAADGRADAGRPEARGPGRPGRRARPRLQQPPDRGLRIHQPRSSTRLRIPSRARQPSGDRSTSSSST